MRERLETLALAVSALALVALLASSIAGVLRSSSTRPALAGAEPSRGTALTVPPTARGRVEVLNAAGRAGLARRATEQLRAGGYDVVYFGNAESRRDSSVVLDRVGQPAIARGAGERLGIGRVRTEPDSTLLLDATILLGADWVGATIPEPAAARPDWRTRIRRWLGGS